MRLASTLAVTAALVATAAQAQTSYSSFTASVALTNAQICAHTGQSSASFITVGTGPDGRVYLYTANGVSDANAKLVSVDLSGSTPVFTTIATQAQILPFLDAPGPHVYNLNIDNSGVVYLQEFVLTGQIDDVLRIVPGSPPTVTNLRRINGIAGVRLNRAQDRLFITQVENYLAASNDFVSIPVGGGADSVFCSEASLVAATGAPQAGLSCAPVETSAGGWLCWDETGFEGSDTLVGFSAGGVPSVVVPIAGWDGGRRGGVFAMGIDADDGVFCWNLLPAAGGQALIIRPAGGTGPQTRITKALIDSRLATATGGAYTYTMNAFGNGMAVHTGVSETRVYLADSVRGDVVQLSFPRTPAGVAGWHLYGDA